MARVLILNPPTAIPASMPLLAQMYVSASLLNSGHTVKIIDMNAKYSQYDYKNVISEIKSYDPSVICITLYTPTARFTYDFVLRFKSESYLEHVNLIAGGPHATAVPEEPLNQGFDIVVRREGEYVILELMEHLEGKTQLKKIKGISYKSIDSIYHNALRPFLTDLDSLPLPVKALELYDPSWYFKSSTMENIPASVITSRGCPSRCTYCANLVTGRRFRYRSAKNILDELEFYHTKYNTTFFSFWDDAFTSNMKRVSKLCKEFKKLQKSEGFEFKWSCITRADKLSKKLLSEMHDAGCISINFGVESGSSETLKKIKKDIDLQQVIRSLEWCKAVGLRTQVNFMLGFPWEGVRHLQETLDFLVKIKDLTDAFSARGVVVPYSGTEIYEKYKDEYGFENWWLKSNMELMERSEQLEDVYFKDPALKFDFFKYRPSVKAMIKKCLEFKGKHTMENLRIDY